MAARMPRSVAPILSVLQLLILCKGTASQFTAVLAPVVSTTSPDWLQAPLGSSVTYALADSPFSLNGAAVLSLNVSGVTIQVDADGTLPFSNMIAGYSAMLKQPFDPVQRISPVLVALVQHKQGSVKTVVDFKGDWAPLSGYTFRFRDSVDSVSSGVVTKASKSPSDFAIAVLARPFSFSGTGSFYVAAGVLAPQDPQSQVPLTFPRQQHISCSIS